MTLSASAGDELILAVNSGSSSLKLGWFLQTGGDEEPILTGIAENIGRDDGSVRLLDAKNVVLEEQAHRRETQASALEHLCARAAARLQRRPGIVGHRIVHGGPELTKHQGITAAVLASLQAAIHFAPLHLPAEIELIQQAQRLFPEAFPIACFDTAFHRTMPEMASRLAIPDEFHRAGVRKYGFHGLSYESVVHRLGEPARERVVVAHLGGGSSVCAMRWGISVDTTMGLTPTGGVPMATRSGDLDPGVILFLMRMRGLGADELESLLNRRSGLLAVSGGEADMQALLRMQGDAKAALAVEMYAAAVRMAIGAYAALLGGVDLLVFTGGIGEHSAEIRELVCEGLGFLGLSVGSERVRAMATEEERQIARICRVVASQRSTV